MSNGSIRHCCQTDPSIPLLRFEGFTFLRDEGQHQRKDAYPKEHEYIKSLREFPHPRYYHPDPGPEHACCYAKPRRMGMWLVHVWRPEPQCQSQEHPEDAPDPRAQSDPFRRHLTVNSCDHGDDKPSKNKTYHAAPKAGCNHGNLLLISTTLI